MKQVGEMMSKINEILGNIFPSLTDGSLTGARSAFLFLIRIEADISSDQA